MDGFDRSFLLVCSVTMPNAQWPHSYVLHWPTVDYVLGNLALANVLSSCSILDDYPLNTSDHLPITLTVDLSLIKQSQPSTSISPMLNWELSQKDGSISTYSSLSDDLVKPLMNIDYSCIEELDKDISVVCQSLVDIASSTIHVFKVNACKNPRISDSFLLE